MKLTWTAISALLAKSPALGLLMGGGAAVLVGVAGYGAVSLLSHTRDVHAASAPADDVAATEAAPQTAGTHTLTEENARTMLLRYSIENCPVSRVVFGAEGDFPVLDALESEWTRSGRYSLASSAPIRQYNEVQQGTMQDVLTHDNPVNPTLTVRMTVTINKYAQTWFRQRQYYGCLLMPVRIDVLDTTTDPGGKQATVVFRYGPLGRTDFGNEMMFRASPATSGPYAQVEQDPRWTAEHTAYFQRLDATGWRVDSIR